jgi:hypothetical protein
MPSPEFVEEMSFLCLKLIKWAGSIEIIGHYKLFEAGVLMTECGKYDETLEIFTQIDKTSPFNFRGKKVVERLKEHKNICIMNMQV